MHWISVILLPMKYSGKICDCEFELDRRWFKMKIRIFSSGMVDRAATIVISNTPLVGFEPESLNPGLSQSLNSDYVELRFAEVLKQAPWQQCDFCFVHNIVPWYKYIVYEICGLEFFSRRRGLSFVMYDHPFESFQLSRRPFSIKRVDYNVLGKERQFQLISGTLILPWLQLW